MITSEWINLQVQGWSGKRTMQVEGEAYYRMENTFINKVTKQFLASTDSGATVPVNSWQSNQKLPSGFVPLMVRQKVSYSINRGMSVDIGGKTAEEVLGSRWLEHLTEAAMEASKKGYAVWHFYYDKGAVKYKRIPAEEVIPVYYDGKLIYVIRQYSRMDKGTKKMVRVFDVWDDEKRYTYEIGDGEKWVYKGEEPHYQMVTTTGSLREVTGEKGFGVPPFSILWNNEYLESDLRPIKPHVDAYDLADSDFFNQLADYNSPFWVLRNYGGQGASEFQSFLNKYRTVFAEGNGEHGADASLVTPEVAHAAKTAALDRKRNDIFLYGMGVDTATVEGNVTNVRIRSMYDNLDKKATEFEKYVTWFLQDSIAFMLGKQEDPESVGVMVSYSRDAIIDREAMIRIANESQGRISEYERLKLYPMHIDYEEELARMSEDAVRMFEMQGLHDADEVEQTQPLVE